LITTTQQLAISFENEARISIDLYVPAPAGQAGPVLRSGRDGRDPGFASLDPRIPGQLFSRGGSRRLARLSSAFIPV